MSLQKSTDLQQKSNTENKNSSTEKPIPGAVTTLTAGSSISSSSYVPFPQIPNDIECEIHESQEPENPQNAIPDDSTLEIECEIQDMMKIPDNEIINGEKIIAENSMLDDGTIDNMECEVLDTMNSSIPDSPEQQDVSMLVDKELNENREIRKLNTLVDIQQK